MGKTRSKPGSFATAAPAPANRSPRKQLKPEQIFVGSFALLILVGTLGFKLFPGLYTGEPMSWLDALFLSTSAVCVTGLSVIDIAKDLTFAGQAWLLLMIQLGGLGVITFASLFVLLLGGRLSLRQQAATGSLEVPHPVDPRRLLFDIVRFTFALEVIGAAGLYLIWEPILGTEAIWHAIFHSISAFCNAGFSTLPDGLISMQTNPLGLILIMALIILGGLGFLTMEEVLLRVRAVRRNQPFRLSLHSRLVLSTTFWLILLGWALFMLLEGSRTLIDMTWPNRLVNALFLSVTPRTAGFNTIDYAKAGETSNFFTVLLMTVGGSPGSTAGGIKTTTLALICLTAWSRFRGVSVVSAFDRSVRQELLARAIGLVVLAFVVVISGTMILTITEEGRPTPEAFLGRLFEAVSAFNTVGLTMGVTPHLSAWGKWTVILLMFIGRVGTLTFVGAVSRQVEQGRFRYAYEDVMIG